MLLAGVVPYGDFFLFFHVLRCCFLDQQINRPTDQFDDTSHGRSSTNQSYGGLWYYGGMGGLEVISHIRGVQFLMC